MKIICLLSAVCLVSSVAGASRAPERVQLAKDGHGFVLARSETPFLPWGMNYPSGRLLDDEWETSWPTVVAGFRRMKDLGANVVRVHLQVAAFMKAADQPRTEALDRLRHLIALAEQTGLYLDVTGLACYRPSDNPKWYDALDEAGRWAAQARFWEAVAAQCARSDAIFCYDLMNEPLAPAGKRESPSGWYSGKLFGGYDFLQWIALDQAGRQRPEIARAWIRRLTQAIRKHDGRHLITVGLLPSTPQWGHLSGFVPEEVAPELDFVSVHIYPEKGKVAEAVATLKGFAVGKPLVIEETFPLSCPASDLEEFLRQSRQYACGWIGHYGGEDMDRLERLQASKKLAIGEAIMLSWLELFRKMKPDMVGP